MKDRRGTTDPELAQHRWDIDRAEDDARSCVTRVREMSGCGHDVTGILYRRYLRSTAVIIIRRCGACAQCWSLDPGSGSSKREAAILRSKREQKSHNHTEEYGVLRE